MYLVSAGRRTYRPWTHTSDDSYIYQLSLVVATATVSLGSYRIHSGFLYERRGDTESLILSTYMLVHPGEALHGGVINYFMPDTVYDITGNESTRQEFSN